MLIKQIQCKSAIGKCNFPAGGFSLNPYIGCEHACAYCYATFMKRFTNHKEPWGEFIDAKINIKEIITKQLLKSKYNNKIYIGTVTDPYQPIESKLKLTRESLKQLLIHQKSISILTKSNLILRDLDLIKQFQNIEVNITINTLNQRWQQLTEPNVPSIKQRLDTIKQLTQNNIKTFVLIGPYWPYFTEIEKLFNKFKILKVNKIFSESFNTKGSNFTKVEKILKIHYPYLLNPMKQILFNKDKFTDFYNKANTKIQTLSKKYNIKTEVFFGIQHKKFEKKKKSLSIT